MTLERIQQGKLAMDCSPFDLNDVAREVRVARAPEFEIRDVYMDEQLPERALEVMGDRRHAVEVVHNYLGNAVKFAPPGSTVRVTTRAVDGRVRLEVRDEGPGVPEDKRGELFQEFVQLAQPGCRDLGSGLGLAIARKLVECQGGDVGAEFPASGGSIFWFELPAAVAHDSTVIPAAQQAAARFR